jgi:hypothetical protein
MFGIVLSVSSAERLCQFCCAGRTFSFLNLNHHVEAELWLRPGTADFQDILCTHFHSPTPDILFGMFAQKHTVSFTLCAISGFCRGVNETCALLDVMDVSG